ncbi:TetR/AcrR family transcriptional regulator [Leifsonia poae]|uniref:TetR/AcrR family transcriptional regulator n=1 Tax=Leifsonia poae TaxID=110933 RepID=UPI0027E20C08|nr:helix-turn-helix domain-containing protein [Leifsonia poae]
MAETLFVDRGFAATTVRQIAAAAGVSAGTVMAAGDKRGLLVAIVDRWIAQVRPDPGALPPGAPPAADSAGVDVTDRILLLVLPFLDLFAENMGLAREYGAILVSGSHDSVIFHGLAGVLSDDIERELSLSGLAAERIPSGVSAIYLSYLGTLLAWAGGAAEVQLLIDRLRSVIDFVAHPQGE